MYCTQCGNPNPDGANHCVVCGAQLMGAAPTEPEVAPQQNVSDYETTMTFNQDTVQSPSYDSYQAPAQESYQAPAQESYQTPSYDSYQQNTYQTNDYSQQSNSYYSAPTPQELPAKGLGLASMIMGICSLVLCLGCWLFPVPVASIVMGFIAKSKAKAVGMKNSQATIGIVLSIISIVAVIIGVVVYYVIIIAAATASTPSYDYYYFINNFMM